MSRASRVTLRGHAFLSYVREDAEDVDRLQEALEAAGIAVWRDTANLWPGQEWKVEIERAIADGSLAFVACFSSNSAAREISYQREEILLAVEQIRRREPGRPWFIPVRFSDCALPLLSVGAGRDLNSFQRIDLFGAGTQAATARLIAAILRAMDEPTETADISPDPSDGHVAPGAHGRWPEADANRRHEELFPDVEYEYRWEPARGPGHLNLFAYIRNRSPRRYSGQVTLDLGGDARSSGGMINLDARAYDRIHVGDSVRRLPSGLILELDSDVQCPCGATTEGGHHFRLRTRIDAPPIPDP